MYQITPTQLDAFARFERNQDEESFNSLLDMINRVKSELSEPQLKGIALEKAITGVKTEFYFDPFIIAEFQRKIVNNIGSQIELSAEVNGIRYYGIADYMFPEMILDVKGTGNYYYGKFKKNNQFPVYSFINELNKAPIRQFKYLITDYVNVYQETYIPSQKVFDELLEFTGEFIRFINHFKKHITNKSIYGG